MQISAADMRRNSIGSKWPNRFFYLSLVPLMDLSHRQHLRDIEPVTRIYFGAEGRKKGGGPRQMTVMNSNKTQQHQLLCPGWRGQRLDVGNNQVKIITGCQLQQLALTNPSSTPTPHQTHTTRHHHRRRMRADATPFKQLDAPEKNDQSKAKK
jgi:hypothetical protein